MKRFLLLLLVIAVAYIAYNRQRLFLRDPLARMYINNTQVNGAQVFINYSNDVLILRDNAAPLIVQNWDHTPGNTKVLPCLHSMACLTEADQAPKFPLPIRDPQTSMTNREITFHNETGHQVRITLR